jgi:hypothetical protein
MGSVMNLIRVAVYSDHQKEVIAHYGRFHRFASDFVEFESGPGIFPVAIVEKYDGHVELVPADLIQFLHDRPEVNNEPYI